MHGLLLTNDMMIIFSRNISGFRNFSEFSSSFEHISSQNEWCTSQKWYEDFLFRKFIQHLYVFLDFFPGFFPRIFPPNIFPGVFRIFCKPSNFNVFIHISSQDTWCNFQIWYDDFLFRNFIRYLSFSGFLKINLHFCGINNSYFFREWISYSFQIWYDVLFRFQYFSGFFKSVQILLDASFNHNFWQNLFSVSQKTFVGYNIYVFWSFLNVSKSYPNLYISRIIL